MKYKTIIVGAGSAGCVLASRLTENPNQSVLLLEAGPDYPNLAELPPDIRNGYVPAFSHDWEYQSEPGLLGRSILLPRGKLTGGCSATNACFALRGSRNDYDQWAAQGNVGWSFKEVFPYFRRLETDVDFHNKWHGRDGPIPIRRYQLRELTPAQRAFLKACQTSGLPRVQDLNAPDMIGAGPAPMNTIDGIRQSTALTYLARARSRPNLTVRTNALVDCVPLHNKRATGICLADSSEEIFADRVILSAGTYSSPQILMRSGIGSAEHLENKGITVLLNLAGVGQNLMDHPLLGVDLESPAPENPEENVPFFQTLLTMKSSDDVQGHDLTISPSSITGLDSEDDSSGAFSLIVGLMKPASHGWLRLRSADPKATPIIDLGYFTHPNDMPRMIKGIHAARQIAKTSPLSRLVRGELYPGPKVVKSSELKAAALQGASTYHHPVGTCRMGPKMDKSAVVDSHGRVHGLQNLFVIDASIMPTITSVNTNLPTIMIAERCSARFK